MQKTDTKQSGTTAHRKVTTSARKSRRDMKRPTFSAQPAPSPSASSRQPSAQTASVTNESPQAGSVKISRFRSSPVQAQTTQAQAIQTQQISQTQLQQNSQMQQVLQTQAQQSSQTQKTLQIQQSQAQQPQMKQRSQALNSAYMVNMHSIHKKMRERTTPSQPQVQKKSAQEIKQQAIALAVKKASAQTSDKQTSKKKKSADAKFHFGFGRVVLALACAAAAVFAIVYFVNLNSPDISLKVAAMQTGIEASYPSYIPRDFSLSDITSEDGKVTLNFTNSSNGDTYTLVEEKSSWDSNALLSNYVKKAYGENYTTIRENGLTIYVHNSDAAWVNGGVVYKLECKSGSLTKKQLRAIAVSL